MTMNTKEAVALAKRTVAELFAEDEPTNIALEEIDRNDSRDEWLVTIGFSRHLDDESAFPITTPVFLLNRKRVYKIVRIVGDEFKSVKNRELTVA